MDRKCESGGPLAFGMVMSASLFRAKEEAHTQKHQNQFFSSIHSNTKGKWIKSGTMDISRNTSLLYF